MSIPCPTPKDLAEAGYRIELGDPHGEDGQDLANKYWWTWSVGSGLDVSEGEWDTAEEAIADARRDLQNDANFVLGIES
jgi:hypothetical protein